MNEALPGDRPLSRYQTVAQTLETRIRDGVYPVGSLLPPEFDLCAEFACSRHTIREALRLLTVGGYLRRRQGSGSQILSAQPQGGYRQTMRSLEELYQYAADTSFQVASVTVARPDTGYLPDFGSEDLLAQTYLRVTGVRVDQGGGAICHVDAFIQERYAAIRDRIGPASPAFYRMLEEEFGLTFVKVQQVFRALPASPEVAALLNLPRRSWVVRVTRRYIANTGECVLIAVNDHPADLFSYQIELAR
jgi:GntR family transcriptional regulator